jgi:serine/threonine protein kinase
MTLPPGRCPACFELSVAGRDCGCGYDPAAETSPLILRPGTSVHGYSVGLVLGTGGFGVTYLGWDHRSGRRVAVKEYLPRDLVGRATGSALVKAHSTEDAGFFRKGLDRFLQEAEVLSRFDHPNVVKVVDFFQENGTAYIVMPYYDGTTLGKLVEQRGRLAPEVAVRVMLGVLDGLSHVHQRQVGGKGWIHRDVKPDNVFLRSEGSPILLDFGAAREEVGEHSRSMTVVLTPGFAPYEQHFMRGKEQGPWVDVYGAAATLYFAVTGATPPSSVERHDAASRGRPDPLLPPDRAVRGLSARLSEAIRQGLAVDHRTRPRDAAEFRTLLRRAVAPPLPSRHRRWWGIALTFTALALATLLGALVMWLLARPGGRTDVTDRFLPPPPRPVATATPAPPVTPASPPVTLVPTQSPSPMPTPEPTPPTGCEDARTRWGQVRASTRAGDHEAFVARFPACPEAAAARRRIAEIEAWASIRDSSRPEDFEEHLRAYPRGLFVREAKARQAVLRQEGHLDLVVRPWAAVKVDDRRVGETPFSGPIRLPAGMHVLVLENPGFLPLRKTVRIEAGRTTRLDVNLEDEAFPPR